MEQEDGTIDLLFTDLVMPGSMNGLVLAERVREHRPDVAVLLTTGYNEELLAEGPSARGWDVLGKPYRHTELADRVRAALNSKDRVALQPQGRSYSGPAHEG
jgi:CheY-like chemotaxis protein